MQSENHQIDEPDPNPQLRGRVLARLLAEDVTQVQAAMATFTLPPEPGWPPDFD